MKDVTVYMRSLHQHSKKGKKGERKLLVKNQAPPPCANQKKISVDAAAKIYDGEMKHLISLEMKRIEAAVKSEVPYKSPLVRVGTYDENGS